MVKRNSGKRHHAGKCKCVHQSGRFGGGHLYRQRDGHFGWRIQQPADHSSDPGGGGRSYFDLGSVDADVYGTGRRRLSARADSCGEQQRRGVGLYSNQFSNLAERGAGKRHNPGLDQRNGKPDRTGRGHVCGHGFGGGCSSGEQSANRGSDVYGDFAT